MRLVVKTDSPQFFEDPEDFRSTDRCASVIRAFCCEHRLPYSDTFVSIAVLGERSPSPLRPVRKRHVYNANDEFGQYAIELTDEVITDIKVVTVRDFQTVICAAIQVYCGDPTGHELSQYLQMNLFDLRRKSLLEKKAVLEGVSKRAPHAAYAEARIFRCLRTVDKHPVFRP